MPSSTEKPIFNLINIIVVLLICVLFFVYKYISDQTDPNIILSFMHDTIPSINAGLIAYIAIYFALYKQGISKEQRFKNELITLIKENMASEYNAFINKQTIEMKSTFEKLNNSFFDDNFQNKLITSAKELSNITDLQQRMAKAGISNFYASRDDYALYRDAPKLIDFLRLANKEIYIAAHWMAHGTEIEGIPQKIAELTKSPKNVKVTIAIVDPLSSCVQSLAGYLGMESDEVTSRIKRSLNKLHEVRKSLSSSEKQLFVLKVYDVLPIASIIMIDPNEVNGRLQLDLKIFETERQNSFGFELKNSSLEDKALYSLCRDSWIKMINISKTYNPSDYKEKG